MIFDVIVLAAIVVSCAIACLRGFIREVLTILGVVGGSFAAVYIGPPFAPIVKGWIGGGETTPASGTTPPGGTVEGGAEKAEKLFGIVSYGLAADILAYGSIFLVVVIILSIVSHFLAKGAKAIGLGALDRSFGVLFGFARAVLLLAILYLPVMFLTSPEKRDTWFHDSRSRVYIETTANWIVQKLPQGMADEAKKQAEENVLPIARERLQNMQLLPQQEGGMPGGENGGNNGSDNGAPRYPQDQFQDMNAPANDGSGVPMPGGNDDSTNE